MDKQLSSIQCRIDNQLNTPPQMLWHACNLLSLQLTSIGQIYFPAYDVKAIFLLLQQLARMQLKNSFLHREIAQLKQYIFMSTLHTCKHPGNALPPKLIKEFQMLFKIHEKDHTKNREMQMTCKSTSRT